MQLKFFAKNFSRGFTLAEVLIATTLFSLAAVIASNVLVDIVQLEKKSSIQNAVYEDSRIILQQLTKTIQGGTIDYEEYYNMYVIQDETSGRRPIDGEVLYGVNYGVYGSRFFDPGRKFDGSLGENPEDLGVLCSYPSPLPEGESCEILRTSSSDLNTGQHPFDAGTAAEQANMDALCHDGLITVGRCGAGANIVPELFIIDSTGTKKTLIGRKRINGSDFAIGMVEMDGKDLDQNGVIDIFSCKDEYDCYGGSNRDEAAVLTANAGPDSGYFLQPFIQAMGTEERKDYVAENNIRVPQRSDLDEVFDINTSQFIPISPLRSNIEQLYFIINPTEDPYKAYSETAVQAQPSVTIIMRIGLSAGAQEDYPGEFPDINIQTTVAAGVIGRIESYPPVSDILEDDSDESWICDALPSAVLDAGACT